MWVSVTGRTPLLSNKCFLSVIWSKFHFAPIQILIKWSLQYLAHGTTARLSCVACAKFCCDMVISYWIRAKWNFHRIWIVMEKSLVKWAKVYWITCQGYAWSVSACKLYGNFSSYSAFLCRIRSKCCSSYRVFYFSTSIKSPQTQRLAGMSVSIEQYYIRRSIPIMLGATHCCITQFHNTSQPIRMFWLGVCKVSAEQLLYFIESNTVHNMSFTCSWSVHVNML